MTGFFINGTFFISPNENYYMRFLFELKYDFIIKIYKDQNKNDQLTEHYEIGTRSVKSIDIQISNVEINSLGYKRFYYVIINLDSNKVEFDGSFPIISSDYKKDLELVFLSCNDNLKSPEKWNTYHEGISSNLWKSIGEKKHDIIIHMGDQIYADSVGQLWIDEKINESEVKAYLRNLYLNTYSEPNQSEVMRNSLNFIIFDDHDIKDCFGTPKTPNTVKNEKFNIYKKIAYEYLKKYQLSLVNIEFNDDTNLSYSIDIGKYKFILIDMRSQFFYTGQIFTKKIIDWTKKTLNSNLKNEIFIILPRPIGGTGKYLSLLASLYLKDALDEPIHPHNYEQTMKFLNVLFAYKIKSKNKIRILSGDVHECYKKLIYFKNKYKNYHINQYISSAITRSCRANDSNLLVKILFGITDNFNLLFLNGIGNKNLHSINNNFGEISNGKIKFYVKKEKNIEQNK